MPLSQQREPRSRKTVDRLGVVSGEAPRRAVRTGAQRRQPGAGAHMERAGAHGGPLKYLIKAGAALKRRIARLAGHVGEQGDG